MATFIQNQANLTYNYGEQEGYATSNIATTVVEDALTAQKTVLNTSYNATSPITYILSMTNTSTTNPLTNVQITDNLGTFTNSGITLTPLTFVGPAKLYLNGIFNQDLTPVTQPNSFTFTIPSVPAETTAMIVYQAIVNNTAPLQTGASITNTTTFIADGMANQVTASANITIDNYANVSIVKSMSPNPVTSGSPLTYTFNIYNYGNVAAERVVLTDTFSPAPDDISITLNGTVLSNADYTYTNGILTLPSTTGTSFTIPAATFTRNADGTINTNPGTATVVVQGII